MRIPSRPSLDLPPPFRLVTLREVGDAFAHAVAVAAEEGAGTLVQVGRFDLAEFAVVLEPEEPLRGARRALYAGLAALADALAAHAPPERPITLEWPDAVRVDGGLVGGARLAWPPGAAEDAPPDWLVFGAMIRTVAIGEEEPGLRPLSAALEEEGFDELGSGRLIESFARHFMVVLDTWQESGFEAAARGYLARLAPEKGVRRDLDAHGDLLVRRMGRSDVEHHHLVRALAQPSWLDPRPEVRDDEKSAMKLLRTIRLDPSDTFVFEHAAEPGEWAVSGAFLFADADPATLSGKAQAAFRGGLLGVPSLGWSTLAQIVEAGAPERAALVELLADELLARLGAPDPAAARAAAEDEVAFTETLCDQPGHTLIAVRRTFEQGAIREAFRTLRPRGERKPMRAYSFVEVTGDETDENEEAVDLVGLAKGTRSGS